MIDEARGLRPAQRPASKPATKLPISVTITAAREPRAPHRLRWMDVPQSQAEEEDGT
ncbi:hypothetical protein [Paenibacillus odorifer]|uniref:hypothetical protein n=1 Tax=Paenibacillus odorifer TaxID=189426 RepID=UPI0015C3384E|nr:hypothetical protein [Paenibacillus odorifer]